MSLRQRRATPPAGSSGASGTTARCNVTADALAVRDGPVKAKSSSKALSDSHKELEVAEEGKAPKETAEEVVKEEPTTVQVPGQRWKSCTVSALCQHQLLFCNHLLLALISRCRSRLAAFCALSAAGPGYLLWAWWALPCWAPRGQVGSRAAPPPISMTCNCVAVTPYVVNIAKHLLFPSHTFPLPASCLLSARLSGAGITLSLSVAVITRPCGPIQLTDAQEAQLLAYAANPVAASQALSSQDLTSIGLASCGQQAPPCCRI